MTCNESEKLLSLLLHDIVLSISMPMLCMGTSCDNLLYFILHLSNLARIYIYIFRFLRDVFNIHFIFLPTDIFKRFRLAALNNFMFVCFIIVMGQSINDKNFEDIISNSMNAAVSILSSVINSKTQRFPFPNKAKPRHIDTADDLIFEDRKD